SLYDELRVGDHFLGVGALKMAPKKFQFGFFRSPAADASRAALIKDVPSIDYYVVGNHHIAGLNNRDFALLMSPHPLILELSPTGHSRTLDVIPHEFRVLPLKSPATGPRSDEAMYREIEGLSIPVGLYGQDQDDVLYLLTRQAGPQGDTIWRLFQIDVDKGHVVGSPMVLPTHAHHLTAVNTAENWYFFERGVVSAAGNQAIPSMMVISNASIKARRLPVECQNQ
ncbi:MAG TPA: hypothetical protein VGG20_04115, partial [Thermoanaerobaculia bacterium]